MTPESKISRRKVRIVPVRALPDGDLGEKILRKCAFCEKDFEMPQISQKLALRLSKLGLAYCPFCLRNDFHTRINKHVLMLSFRSIIGYYYQQFYAQPVDNRKYLYLSQIEDYVRLHYRAGSLNPVFVYDAETFVWFLNFSKVGPGPKQITLEEVMQTVVNILFCFDLQEYVAGLNISQFFEKYSQAITSFHSKRYRPNNCKLLVPTFHSCGGTYSDQTTMERTKEFIAKEMLIKS